jgi:hypothetical protein
MEPGRTSSRPSFRSFLAVNSEALGVPLLFLCVAILFIALLIPLLPTGPVRHLEGEITALGMRETYEGSHASASVKLEGRIVRIEVPTRYDCRVGDRIQLTQRPTRWGSTTRLAMTRWPCARS